VEAVCETNSKLGALLLVPGAGGNSIRVTLSITHIRTNAVTIEAFKDAYTVSQSLSVCLGMINDVTRRQTESAKERSSERPSGNCNIETVDQQYKR
jgi:hypothetical protein